MYVVGSLLLVLLILGPIGIKLAMVHRRATEVFDEHANDVREKIDRIFATQCVRPPLFEPAESGDAWDEYALAWKEFDKVSGRPENSAADRAAESSAIEAVSRALHRKRVTLPHSDPWGLGRSLSCQQIRCGENQLAGYISGLAFNQHQKGRDSEALELVILGLAVAADLRRGSTGYLTWMNLCNEENCFWRAQEILASHSLESRDLEKASCVLERLRGFRPSIHDAVQADGVLRRETVLAYERLDCSLGPGETSAGRKHLYSLRLARAAELDEIRQVYREYDRLRTRPTVEWIPGAKKVDEDPRFRSEWQFCLYGLDVQDLIHVSLLRAGVALAWFDLENGRRPSSLAELLPRYSKLPLLCGGTGLPLGYDAKSGKIWSPALPDRAWTVHHR